MINHDEMIKNSGLKHEDKNYADVSYPLLSNNQYQI
jgi:hypothetical protein